MFYNVFFPEQRIGNGCDIFSLLPLINFIMIFFILISGFFVNHSTFNSFITINAPAIKVKHIQDIRGNNSNEIRLNFRSGIV
ncbi:hypothetical protein C3D81_20305 [Cronobacter sakazakii]|nr:hypothetical protein C3D81_20305 [Cronobacter sakazakii]